MPEQGKKKKKRKLKNLWRITSNENVTSFANIYSLITPSFQSVLA